MEGNVGGFIEAAGSRMWKKSRNVLIVGYSAIAVLIGFLAWLAVNGATFGTYNEIYFFAILPALLGYAFYGQWRYTQKVVHFVRVLAPRLRDVTFQGRAGIIVVFDNGVLLRPLRTAGNGPPGFVFGTFLDQDRNPMVPSKDQILPWAKSFSRKQKMGTVSRKRGPESGRSRLEAIRQSLGSTAAFSIVERHDATMPAAPTYYVGVVLTDRKWLTKGEQVSQNIDSIDSFLKEMPVQDFSVPLAPH